MANSKLTFTFLVSVYMTTQYLKELQQLLPDSKMMDEDELLELAIYFIKHNNLRDVIQRFGYKECIRETMDYMINVEEKDLDDPMLIKMLNFLDRD